MIEMIPLTNLHPAPDNVRTVSADKAADKELMASIAASGLWQNLVVRPAEDLGEGEWYVTAGARRLGAMKLLAAEGKLTFLGVPCKIETDTAADEIGLVENLHRAPLHPADKFTAFKRLAERGMSQKEIAQHFGIGSTEVKRLLKLATVHPDIVQAFREGKLLLESVMAYTLTDDLERQLQVFKSGDRDSSWAIRRRLTENAVAAESVLAEFVGVKAYQKAGGTISQDLFQNNRYLDDVKLLEQLAEEKLLVEARKLRKEGYGWVVTSTEAYPKEANLPRASGRYEEPQEYLDRLKAAHDELDRLDNQDPEENEDTEAWSAAYTAAEEKVAELEDERERYRVSDADISTLGALVHMGWNGQVNVVKGLQRPEDRKAAAAVDGQASGGRGEPADTGTPAALLADMMHWRMEAVRLALIDDVATADQLILFLVARLVLNTHWGTPVQLRVDWTARLVQEQSPCAGTQRLLEERSKCLTDWLTKKTVAEQFDAFCRLDSEEQVGQAAWAIGQLMKPEDFAQIAGPLSGMLNEASPINIREAWTPGPEYFGRLRKDRLIELGRELWGDEWHAEHKSWSKASLVELFTCDFRDADLGSPLRTWLPPEMLDGLCEELQP